MKAEVNTFADLIKQIQNDGKFEGDDVSSPFGTPLPKDHKVINMDAEKLSKEPDVDLDYTPHFAFFNLPHDTDDYENTLKLLTNKRNILRYEERTFSKEGDFLVAVCYLSYEPRPVKEEEVEEKPLAKQSTEESFYSSDDNM